ncbi:MAG: hypothetical protein IBX72_16555 [Nitrospirae bacterium]|nr:hypothetical protein [Nitrospirota bacterium]
MDPLSEGFVEKTWQQVAEFTPDRANKEMIAMGKNQPDLLAFLMAYTDDLQQEVKELAIYIAFVIYKMFLDSSSKIPKISSKEIMARYDENIRLIESLEGAHEKFIERIAGVQVSNQPYVMRYVLETHMEDAVEDSIDLTDEDIGLLFILFKTEIEVLDKRT